MPSLTQKQLEQIAAQNAAMLKAQGRSAESLGFAPYQAPAVSTLPTTPYYSDRTLGIDSTQYQPTQGGQRTLDFGTANSTPQSNPVTSQYGYLTELLARAQREGTKFKAKTDLASLNAQDEQARRIEQTDPGLIGASPGQQASARNASASAVQPTINSAQQLGATFGEQTANLANGIKTAQDYLQFEAERQDKERADARDYVFKMFETFDGDKLWEVIDPKQLKLAGFNPEQINELKVLQAKGDGKYAAGSIGEYQFAVEQGYKGSFTDYQNEDANRKAKASGAGVLTLYQSNQLRNQVEDNLRTNPAVKAYGDLVNFGVPNVISQFNAGIGDSVSDTILMRSLAKVTDPTTGVREEEYRTFAGAQGALGQVYSIPKHWLGRGRLTPEGRAAMIREIQDRYKSREADYLNQYQYYSNQAARDGLTVPPPYKASVNANSTPASAGTTAGGNTYKIVQ